VCVRMCVCARALVVCVFVLFLFGRWLARCWFFVRYAEETGDFAQQRELRSVMEALDSDGDGCIGLLDFVLFAARRKVGG